MKLNINNRVADLLKGLTKIGKKLVKYTVNLIVLLAVIGTTVYIAARAPELHGQWLRHSVGSKVYTIKDTVVSGGGTGFAIQAPSGASYILTNDHVCRVSTDKQTVLVQN